MIFASLIAALGLAAVTVGSIVDWIEVDVPFVAQFLPGAPSAVALQGIDIAQGKYLLLAGGVGTVAALLGLMPGFRRVAGVIAVGVGASALSIAGTDVAMALQVPEIPLPIPSDAGLPTFPGAFPTDLPTDFQTGFATESTTTTPAAEVRQIPGGGSVRLDVGIGLWLVSGGGLLALIAGAALTLARGPATREPRTSSGPPVPPG